MRHSAVSEAPCQLGKDFHKGIWSVSIYKRIQVSICAPSDTTLCDQICQIARKQEICYQWYDQKANKHQSTLYKVCDAHCHKSSHKGVAEDNCCSNGKCHMVIQSEYGVKQFSACCQGRCCIYQKKDYDNNR